ncbi:hypothetical protein D9M73_196320 [compost metagenome]
MRVARLLICLSKGVRTYFSWRLRMSSVNAWRISRTCSSSRPRSKSTADGVMAVATSAIACFTSWERACSCWSVTWLSATICSARSSQAR